MRVGWILAIVGGVVAIIGTFLPWLTVTGTNIAGYGTTGGIAIIIFGVLGLVFVFLRRAGARLTIIFGLLVAVLAALTFIQPSLLAPIVGGTVIVQYGVWVSLAGGVVMMLAGFIAGMEAKRIAQQKAVAAGH